MWKKIIRAIKGFFVGDVESACFDCNLAECPHNCNVVIEVLDVESK